MNMTLEYRTNNAFDSVLLVDNGIVRSDWTVTPEVLREFADLTQAPDDWYNAGGDEHTPSEYGELVATRKLYDIDIEDYIAWNERVERFADGTRGQCTYPKPASRVC